MERKGSMTEQEVLNKMTSARLISNGSISFDVGEDLTTEKLSSEISLGETLLMSGSDVLLVIDKPEENTAGELTINMYNLDKVDETNTRNVSHAIFKTVNKTGSGTYESHLVKGLFVGSEKKIKLGMSFVTDGGAIEVFYKLYRL